MKALRTSHEPQKGADLVEYVAAVNWMRSAIPNYSKRLASLKKHWRKCSRIKAEGLKKLQPQCRYCRNTPLLTSVTSTADELTSFVYSALLLGCGVSMAEDNRGI
jgi:hypothetical protein